MALSKSSSVITEKSDSFLVGRFLWVSIAMEEVGVGKHLVSSSGFFKIQLRVHDFWYF